MHRREMEAFDFKLITIPFLPLYIPSSEAYHSLMRNGGHKDVRKYSVLYYPVVTGGYAAFFPAFPEITVWYPTLRQCRKAAKEALALHLEGLKALGERLPRQPALVTQELTLQVA